MLNTLWLGLLRKLVALQNWLPRVECVAIAALWLASVWVSSLPAFDLPLDWDNAHVLVSLRAFEQWGAWQLLGISSFVQQSYEWTGVPITTQPVEVGSGYLNFYLSAPSWYVIFPYLGLQLAHLIPFVDVALSPLFLESYNLLIGRLVAAVFVYLVYLEVIRLLVDETWSEYQRKLVAFLGLAGWILTPYTLFATQNSCFAGRAYIGFLYAVFFLALQCRFDFGRLSGGARGALFFLSFVACATDHYGAFALVTLGLIALVERMRLRQARGALHLLRDYLRSVAPMVAGAAIALAHFAIQLVYYGNGFGYLAAKFLYRSGLAGLVDDHGNPVTNLQVFTKLISHWAYFAPVGQFRLQALVAGAVSPQGVDLKSVSVLCLVAAGFALALLFLAARSRNTRTVAYAYLILFGVPMTYLLLLRQVAFVHELSGFGMGLPLAFTFLIVPLCIIGKYSRTRSLVILVSFVLLGASDWNWFNSLPSRARAASDDYQDFGALVQTHVAKDELPFSHQRPYALIGVLSRSLVVQPFSPQALWYSGRYVYDVVQLKQLLADGKLNRSNVLHMRPVFLVYESVYLNSKSQIGDEVLSTCDGKWELLDRQIGQRRVMACRAPELRRLYLGE